MAAATATTGCAVCLGTGWVGGYDPSNALRVVYDAQAQWSGSLTADKSTRPESWTLLGDRSVAVKILMPAGAVGLEAFRVWNNRDQINQVQAFLETPEGNLPFSQDLIRFCDGTYRNLILVFAEEVTTFTHVELQFEMGLNPIYADWSRLTYNENLQLPENMDAPSLVISPSLPHVAMYDLVTESVYRKLWKITSSNPAFDRDRQIHGWEVQARLMQTYELPNLLPRRQERVWYWGNKAVQQPRDRPNTNALLTTRQQVRKLVGLHQTSLHFPAMNLPITIKCWIGRGDLPQLAIYALCHEVVHCNVRQTWADYQTWSIHVFWQLQVFVVRQPAPVSIDRIQAHFKLQFNMGERGHFFGKHQNQVAICTVAETDQILTERQIPFWRFEKCLHLIDLVAVVPNAKSLQANRTCRHQYLDSHRTITKKRPTLRAS
jgi:hypothetical protein